MDKKLNKETEDTIDIAKRDIKAGEIITFTLNGGEIESGEIEITMDSMKLLNLLFNKRIRL